MLFWLQLIACWAKKSKSRQISVYVKFQRPLKSVDDVQWPQNFTMLCIFNNVWIKNILSTYFDVVNWACKNITRVITRFKVEMGRFLKFFLATFKMILCRSKAITNLCIHFSIEIKPFVIISLDMRSTRIFFWDFLTIWKASEIIYKFPLKLDSSKALGYLCKA